ncbi:MAG: hypothetical protein ACXW2E_11545, partial [Nitrososphaeraceae archaeon]
MNLQTIRFQIFNILDTWHTNWADDYNYSHLLYEDLGIRSYFVGVFYRLRMPTNYIYIHRMAGGSTLMLNTDIYFYKPLKRTKLHRYFIEQRQYYNYLLKLYVYLTPYLVRSINKQIKYVKYRRRYLNTLSTARIRRFTRKGYVPFKVRKSSFAGIRVRTIKDLRYLRHAYRTSCVSNGLLLAGFRSLQRRKKRLRRLSVSRMYSVASTSFARLFSVFFYNSFIGKYVYLFKDLSRAFGIFSLVSTSAHRQFLYNSQRMMYSLFNSNFFYVNSIARLKTSTNVSGGSFYFTLNSTIDLYTVLYFGMAVLKRIRGAKYLGLRKSRSLSKRLRSFFRSLAFTFYGWFLLKLKAIFFLLIYKLVVLSSFCLHNLFIKRLNKSRLAFISNNFTYFSRALLLLQCRLSISTSITNTISSTFLNIHSGKANALYFLNIIRNIHRRFYQKRKARAVVRQIPKQFNYSYLTRNYITLVFSYLSNHIERVLGMYTKQQVFFLYNLFYLGNKYYPAILNAKVLCDYFVYLIHTKRSMRGAFFKIRQWQVDNIKRRLSLESMHFKTQMRGKPLSYIDHLSYKKYPIIGIRIECSGNKKKGTMSRKTFYGDIIRDRLIV